MLHDRLRLRPRLLTTAAAAMVLGVAGGASAQEEDPKFEIYGFAQADYVQDFDRVDPNWDDTLRPSRIPTEEGVFGSDGQSIIGVRQSRFGVRATHDIEGKPLTVRFEFDLFGVGDDEGKTTPRLQHFYGTWGPVLAGQTDTLFMDGDTFPNTIDYWGPAGMVYVRTPQIRLTFKTGKHKFSAAIEKPGNDIDPGNIRILDPALGSAIQGDETMPDFTAQWRYDAGFGHLQLAGILRRVGFETAGAPDNEPKGSKTGWGVNASTNIKTWGEDVLHASVVYGEGIASYMNDGGTDLGPETVPIVTPPITPPPGGPIPPGSLKPDVVPLLGLMVYYDHYWTEKLSTSLGWSQTKVDNLSFQSPDAFKSGQYASVNLLYKPASRLMMGAEFLWGRREDFDGDVGKDRRLQISFKYSFSSRDFFR